MKTFRQLQVPNDPVAIPGFLRLFQASVEQATQRADPFAKLQILHAQPDRLEAGIVVYADGVDWNPGSGEGIYRRNKANSAWAFLG